MKLTTGKRYKELRASIKLSRSANTYAPWKLRLSIAWKALFLCGVHIPEGSPDVAAPNSSAMAICESTSWVDGAKYPHLLSRHRLECKFRDKLISAKIMSSQRISGRKVLRPIKLHLQSPTKGNKSKESEPTRLPNPVPFASKKSELSPSQPILPKPLPFSSKESEFTASQPFQSQGSEFQHSDSTPLQPQSGASEFGVLYFVESTFTLDDIPGFQLYGKGVRKGTKNSVVNFNKAGYTKEQEPGRAVQKRYGTIFSATAIIAIVHAVFVSWGCASLGIRLEVEFKRIVSAL